MTPEFQEPLLDNLDDINSKDIVSRYIKFAPVYNHSVKQWGYKTPQLAAQYLKQYLPSTASNILDAGCGTGLVGNELAKLGYTEIIGIDISLEMLALAKETAQYKKLEQHDLTKIPYPFPDNSFAAITSIGVLSLIKDPLPVFSEFHRLLQPNGYMIFTQRENLYTQYDYQKVLEQLEAKELIKLIMMSEPTNYLPNRKNYSERKLLTFIYKVLK